MNLFEKICCAAECIFLSLFLFFFLFRISDSRRTCDDIVELAAKREIDLERILDGSRRDPYVSLSADKLPITHFCEQVSCCFSAVTVIDQTTLMLRLGCAFPQKIDAVTRVRVVPSGFSRD